jgi:recombination protein RecT
MANAMQRQSEAQQGGVTLAGFLEVRKNHLSQVLPKHLKPERLIKLAVLAANRQPLLKKCTMDSVFLSLLTAAELGLEPSGTLGGAYLVPYGATCQLIVGYRGLVDLARRSGVLEQVEAHIVYEGDVFECEFGLTPKLRHVPDLALAGRGEKAGARLVYAVARMKGGAVHAEVMTVAEVERIRTRSKSGSNGPWATDWGEMAKKTVVRRLCKLLPLSPEMLRALEAEDEPEATVVADGEAVEAVVATSRTASLKEKVRGLGTGARQPEAHALEQARETEPVPAEEPPFPSDSDAPAEPGALG